MSSSVGLGLLASRAVGLHDLPGMTVAALRRVGFAPGALHGVVAVRVETFDRYDRLAGRLLSLHGARADRLAAQMHRAGAAKTVAAAELGAGQTEFIA